MDRQNQLQQSNVSVSEPLCCFSINNASADPSWIKTVDPHSRKRRQRSILIRRQSLSLGKNRVLKRMSDATQKPMESAAADEQLECDCGAGKTCPVKGVIDSTFKPHYRGQLIELMTMVIEHACDPNHDSAGDTKRVKNLKNEMDVVRSLTDSWPDLTSMFITGRDPVPLTARKILDVISECEDEMDVNEVLCLCTYVTDLCTLLVSKHYGSMICEIVGSLVDFILQQNMLVCRDFLFWLDRL